MRELFKLMWQQILEDIDRYRFGRSWWNHVRRTELWPEIGAVIAVILALTMARVVYEQYALDERVRGLERQRQIEVERRHEMPQEISNGKW